MIIGVPKEIKNNENRVVFPMQPIQPWERRFYLPWKKYMPLPK